MEDKGKPKSYIVLVRVKCSCGEYITGKGHVIDCRKCKKTYICELEDMGVVEDRSMLYIQPKESAVLHGQKTPQQRKKRRKNLHMAQAKKKKNMRADLEIYTYGVCTRNPGPCASGVLVGQDMFYGGFLREGTKNIAGLQAVIFSLEKARESDGYVIIWADSKYVMQCITIWVYQWKRKKWKNRFGDKVENREYIEEAHAIYDRIKERVQIRLVKSHSGIRGNEIADTLANLGIVRQNESFTKVPPSETDKITSIDPQQLEMQKRAELRTIL
jgi:ribonuclease HI